MGLNLWFDLTKLLLRMVLGKKGSLTLSQSTLKYWFENRQWVRGLNAKNTHGVFLIDVIFLQGDIEKKSMLASLLIAMSLF